GGLYRGPEHRRFIDGEGEIEPRSEILIPSEGYPATLLDPVIEIAIEAGKQILAIYGTKFTVERKEDCSPLTEADLVSHRTILQGLETLLPGVPVLSEESQEIPFAERRAWQCYWLVDPLDGTREFIKGNGYFTVNIALIEIHLPVLGVIYVPVTKALYYAARGHGAYKRLMGENAIILQVRPWAGGSVRVAG